MQARDLSAGFTLIEMVIAITVLGIVSVTIGVFIVPAINSHRDLQRRAELVEAAEGALRRISRDIRIALPNSVRVTNALAVGSGFAIELIPTADGARYCTPGTADCGATDPDPRVLSIGSGDAIFDVLGCFHNTAFAPAVLPGATTAYRLAVGSADSGIYTALGASAAISPAGNTVTISLFPNTGTLSCGSVSGTPDSFNRHRVTLTTAAHTFTTASPRQRVFVVEDALAPVTYICNFAAGTLTRYAGYKMGGGEYSTAAQPTDPGAAPLSAATGRQVVRNVSACSAASTEATVQVSAVVTLSLALTDTGETVQLLKQVQLDNSQ